MSSDRVVSNYISAINGVSLSNVEIDITCGLYYDLMTNVERWLGDLTAQVKILKVNWGEERSLDVLYPISTPLAVRASRSLVSLTLSTSRPNMLITIFQHWDVPTLEEVILCGFVLNDEEGVICGCHNIERLTLQSCCYGGPNEIMKLVLKKFWVLKIEDWNDRGNFSKFSVNVDASLLTDLVLVKHSPNLMFARPMKLKGAVFSLKRYRVNSWTYGKTILNMLDHLKMKTLRISTGCCQAILDRKGEAGTKINIGHTRIITVHECEQIVKYGDYENTQNIVRVLKQYVIEALIFESS